MDQGGSLTALVEGINSGLDLQTTLFGVLRGEVPQLAGSLAGFLAETTEGAESLSRTIAAVGESFLDAFEGAILRGESLGDTLKSLGRDLAGMALNEIKSNGFGSIFDIVGKIFGGGTIASAKGNAFSQGHSLTAYAQGGAFSHGRSLTELAKGGALTNMVVNRPTLFPMAKGMGLMGEAGAEAVIPLTRMSSGDLGVSMLRAGAAAAGPVNVVVNNNIDARGADRAGLMAVERRLGAMENFLTRDLRGVILGTVLEGRRRGGNIARAFGGW